MVLAEPMPGDSVSRLIASLDHSRGKPDRVRADCFGDDRQMADGARAGAGWAIDLWGCVLDERIGLAQQRSRVRARRIDRPRGRESWRSLLDGERV
jgi:hypothetical protein